MTLDLDEIRRCLARPVPAVALAPGVAGRVAVVGGDRAAGGLGRVEQAPGPSTTLVVPELTTAADGNGADGCLPPDLVAASVLVAIVLEAEPGVLLTRRHARLRQHAGQVSFPGGRNDPGDRDAEAAALREAWEEIALPADAVELLGRLPDQATGTGFLITPVLGLVERLPQLRASPDEVDAIFQLPLAVLLDPDAPQRREVELRGRMREIWVWPHPEHHVFGATASILVQLARRLRNTG
jgi:8-oxo-dGTP pyrophosphatase MutT (NUDIX family)